MENIKVAINEKIYTLDESFNVLCNLFLDNTEDAGCNMRNLWVDNRTLVQVYTDDARCVYVLCYDNEGEHEDYILDDFPFDERISLLKRYYRSITDCDSDLNVEIRYQI